MSSTRLTPSRSGSLSTIQSPLRSTISKSRTTSRSHRMRTLSLSWSALRCAFRPHPPHPLALRLWQNALGSKFAKALLPNGTVLMIEMSISLRWARMANLIGSAHYRRLERSICYFNGRFPLLRRRLLMVFELMKAIEKRPFCHM